MTRFSFVLTLAALLSTTAVTVPRGEAAGTANLRSPTRIHVVPRPPAHPAPTSPDAERDRVARHLERVERALRAADVSHLSGAQRTARATHLDALRAYRLAGTFPLNQGLSAARVPIFVDAHGTHCAVGHLLALAGQTELVARIAKGRNTATVPELADEPELLAWLDANGLTAAEAALIQPQYGPIYQLEERDGGYVSATIGLTAASAATATWNVLADRMGSAWYLSGLAGLLSGSASVAMGMSGIDRSETEVLGWGAHVVRRPTTVDVAFNLVAGTISAALGARTLFLGRADDPGPAALAAAQGGERRRRLEVAPTAGGFSASLRF